MTKRVLIFAGLALSLLVLPAASDAGAGVTLYEINERVTFSPKKLEDSVIIFRNATTNAALHGHRAGLERALHGRRHGARPRKVRRRHRRAGQQLSPHPQPARDHRDL